MKKVLATGLSNGPLKPHPLDPTNPRSPNIPKTPTPLSLDPHPGQVLCTDLVTIPPIPTP